MRIKAKDPNLVALMGEFMGTYLPSVKNRDDDTVTSYRYSIHLFLDADLLAKELSGLTGRTEKKNISIEMRKAAEKKKMSKGKGRLTQEELDQMVPLKIDDMFENKDEIGTITIKTNNKSLNAFQVYSIYKQRQTIEQFFKAYADTMEFEASYMKDNYCEEAWLFLNHLSSILSIRILETISAIGEEKNISYKDFAQTLVKIKSNIVSETEWRIVPIKKSVQFRRKSIPGANGNRIKHHPGL